MLKNTSRSFAPFWHSLFSLSLSSADCKVSNVIPIPKGGDVLQCSNYRPISLLSLVSKVLERIVHSQLSDFLFKHSLISRLQFGFHPNSSTQEALLVLTNDWHKELDSGNHVAVIFFDLSKAFDTVPHHLLLEHLQSSSVGGTLLSWFEDYLSARRRVVIDGQSSGELAVTSGVPQGSILGPLLFSVFMNSIFETALSCNSKLALYADDMVLYKPMNNPVDLLVLQNDIEAIHQSTNSNYLHLKREPAV